MSGTDVFRRIIAAFFSGSSMRLVLFQLYVPTAGMNCAGVTEGKNCITPRGCVAEREAIPDRRRKSDDSDSVSLLSSPASGSLTAKAIEWKFEQKLAFEFLSYCWKI